MQIAEITWDDASYNSSSWDRHALHKDFGLVRLVTVGWLVEEKSTCYVLAQEYNKDEDSFRHICAIPKSCISAIRKFRQTRNS